MMHLLYSPLTWLLLLAAAMCVLWRNLAPAWRVAGIVLGTLFLLLFTPLGGNALVRLVESRTPQETMCASMWATNPNALGSSEAIVPQAEMPKTVVLLSAGFDWNPAINDHYSALAPESWRRLRMAVAQWHRHPGSDLVIAGGGPFTVKESVVLAQLARDWGIPAQAIRTEVNSKTTWESAFALRGKVPARIRLLTSSMHLPRALIAFRAAGLHACAEPSDTDYQPPGGIGYFLPQLSGLEKSEEAIYELIGTAVYRARVARMGAAGSNGEHPPSP